MESSHSAQQQPSTGSRPSRPEPLSSQINWPQLLGGAAAAITAAVVGTRLGTAGTLAGAAIASLVAGLAGSIYTTGLHWTRHGVSLAAARLGGGTTTIRPSARGRLVRGASTTVVALVLGLAGLTVWEGMSGSAASGGKQPTLVQVAQQGTVTTTSTARRGATAPGTDPAASSRPTDQTGVADTNPAQGTESPSAQPTGQPSERPTGQATDEATAEGQTTAGDNAGSQPAPTQADGPAATGEANG